MKLLKSCFKFILLILVILFIVAIAKEYFIPEKTVQKQGHFETTATLSGKTLKSSLNNKECIIKYEKIN